MFRRRSPSPYNRPGALCIFLLLIFSTTIIAQTDPNVLTINDAGGTSNFYTSPVIGSSIPQGSTDPDTPRWTNQDCDSCPSPRPSLQNVRDSTYTAIDIPAGTPHTYNISFQFIGTQIKVYLVISNRAPTSCDFVLDGNSIPFITNTTDDYRYQQLAYSSTVLDLRMHELTIRAAGLPDTANYLNFDYAQFTRSRPSVTRSARDLGLPSENATLVSSTLSSPSPSPSATNQHETMKAIAGGVVGGFIAIVSLICVASFYRHRRLRELEQAAHPFAIDSNASAMFPTSPEEQRHLMSLPISQSSNHHHTPSWHPGAHAPTTAGVTPFTLRSPASADPLATTIRFSHPDLHPNAEYQNQVRQERQRELNHRLETVTTQMRLLKSSYIQDQQRLQNQHQQVQHAGYSGGNHDLDPPVIRLIPGGLPDPVLGRNPGSAPVPSGGEPMVSPTVLADMRQQMQVMMDQIQYLRTQQNSPYAQGLTDEPPPGYTDVINAYHGHDR